MAACGSTSNVPEGFHYETKYVLLCYLGLPPRPPARSVECEEGASGHAAQKKAVEKTSRMKEQIEEHLKQLEEEITASFPSTGFDRHTSPVFSPANPESTIEDTLAMLGDRVAQVLDTHLTLATQTILSGQLDYEDFQSAVKEVSSHSEGGWSKVLVPLVLMQELHCKGQPLPKLLSMGERYLVEEEADFIIQQGGWGRDEAVNKKSCTAALHCSDCVPCVECLFSFPLLIITLLCWHITEINPRQVGSLYFACILKWHR